jgi:16S rRNA U516 pseudouridylate synthase RsuA-like enzyme
MKATTKTIRKSGTTDPAMALIALNKPYNVLCQFTDEGKGRRARRWPTMWTGPASIRPGGSTATARGCSC